MNDQSGRQTQQLGEIARRLARLDPAKQRAFLTQLAAKGIDLSILPIARQQLQRAPVSFAQARLWFLWRMDPGSSAYNLPVSIRLRGCLDIDALQRALDGLVVRHAALRTVFRQEADEPEQIVGPPQRVELRRIIFAGDDREQQAARVRREQAALPFDLEAGPLLRAALLALGERDHILTVTLHHIVADGWSLQVLTDEFWQLYHCEVRGEAHSLPALEIDYADFANWQRLWIGAVEGVRQLNYWTGRLRDTTMLQLPFDRARGADVDQSGDGVRLSLGAALSDRLRALAQRRRTTLFVVLLSALKLLLHRISGQSDISVGVPIANRDRSETRRLIGLLVNTQVLRTEIDSRRTIADFIDEVREATLDAQEHQDLPFERVLDALQPERSLSQNPLFQVLYNHQRRRDVSDGPVEAALQIETIAPEIETVKFDLALDSEELPSGDVSALFSFATALFDRTTIERFAAHWCSILETMADESTRPIATLDLLSADEREDVRRWNEIVCDPGPFLPVHRMFARHALDRPAAPALVFGTETISYAELDRRANAIARHLIARDVRPGDVVGISMQRSPELIAAFIAVLKAGAAYLPLDPDHPPARQSATIRDAGARVVLVSAAGLNQWPPMPGVNVIELGAVSGKDTEAEPAIAVHPQSLAYVIYTSGSTGVPKGVAVAHGPFAMHCEVTARLYEMDSRSRELHFLSFTFDGAHERLWTALSCGAALVMRDADLWSAEQTLEVMRAQNVTNAGFPPAYLQQLAEFAEWRGNPPPVSLYSFGGEAMPKAGFDKVRRALQPRKLINGYGPTETVVTPLVWKVDAEAEIDCAYAPIGRPVGRRSAYLLDGDLNIVPIGITAELYIGGEGLATGYWNQQRLTAERFVPDPYGEPGARLYRTGDLARWRADGVIDYVGRSDHQLKIRGFRIEPGEIEARLTRQDGVQTAVVVAREIGGRQQLVGYVCAAVDVDGTALRAALLEELPDYMVPARIVAVAQMPLTTHGKVDRDALPLPEHPAAGVDYVAPQTGAELTLAAIWSELLGQPRVGLTDNFFELGGDSIISLQVVGRARQSGLSIEPRDLFRHQTLRELARVARSDQAVDVVERTERDHGPIPLLPIQRRFFAEDAGERHHWNQAVLLMPNARLDWRAMARAVDAIVSQHDALRMRFAEVDGTWQADYGEAPSSADLLWTRVVANSEEITAVAAAAQASLSLQGPLLRLVGMDAADGSQRLLIVVHHLVVDGVSWRILLEDLASAYAQAAQGAAPIVLPPKSQSVASWGRRLENYASTTELAGQLDYWRTRTIAGDLPCDDDHGDIDRVADGEDLVVGFDADLTARLLKDAPAAYRTQVNDLLLAALARAVSRWSGLDEILVELEGHGREDIFDCVELSRTVGWFTTAFPVRLSGCASDDATLIKSIKEELRAIPARGLGYGVLRHCGSDMQREALAGVAEPRIVFNYLGQFGASVGANNAFAVAPESAGASRSASAPLGRWLSINGQVMDRELRLTFSFGCRRYRRVTIERLAECYSAALRELVAHCTSGVHGITPSDVPLSRLSQSELDLLGGTQDWREIEDVYPLSPMQQGMLFHALRDADSGNYVSQIAVDITGVDGPRLRAAWQAVTARHAVLRTAFVWRELSGTPQQLVHRQVAVPFVEEDWRDRAARMDEAARDSALAAIAQAERQAGFDLSRPPLQRVRLIDLGGGVHRLVWTHHHILLDGWSAARLIAEIMQHVRGGSLPAARARYRDYIEWLPRQDQDGARAFWSRLLSPLEEPSLLADALGGPAEPAAGHTSIDLVIDAARTERLQAVARRERVTLNTMLQGAWAQLLRRLTGRQTVCFGATMSGRPPEVAGVEQMVGLFINTVPVLDDTSPQTLVGDWLRGVQDRNVDLREHGFMPLYEIQRLAGRAGRALFDTIFVFENYPVDDVLRDQPADGPRAGRAEQISITNYPLTIAVFVTEAGIRLGFRYDRSRFDQEQIERMQRAFACLLARIADAPARPLADLHGLDDATAQRVIGWSTGAAVPMADDALMDVVAQFERQAAEAPDATALVTENARISYAALNVRANRLARQLRARGVGPDAPVGVAFERSIDMVVAVLAVLKAGAGYLPLDPDYPAQRLATMLQDSGVRLVLTQDELRDRFDVIGADANVDLIVTGAGDQDRPSENEGDIVDLRLSTHAGNLAYVIYTSGSTGTPKGVACTRGALAARLAWMQAEYQVAPSETLLQKTPFSFDVAVWEILWPLTVGARLAIAPPGAHREPKRLIDAVIAHDVTTLHFVPQMLAQFVAETEVARCTTLKRLFSGGEALPVQLMDHVQSVFPLVRFDNRYGPTETLINATFWNCRRQGGRRVPIGYPVPGTVLRILDADLNLVDEGTTGELYIGGTGLARGYLGRAGLTAERFIPDPFGTSGARLYRSGDLARWRSDGAIDYVGRADHQVKIRGFRIELGEIEARLLQQPQVGAAAVITREFGAGRQLVGYVSGDGALDGAALREALAAGLPDYMVPSRIIVLDRLPLMVNGKVDRHALPAPDMGDIAGRVAPRTPNEVALAAIWTELLRQPDVGITDNFFELGGDSIISLQMVSRARRAGLVIEPRDVFKHQTLEALAREARTELASTTHAEQGLIAGPHPLLPIQLRFFEQELDTPDHWNQAVLLRPRQRLDWDALSRAVASVVVHHDALRLRFERVSGVWRAEHEASPVLAELFQVCAVADADAITPLAAEVQASLSLANGPLVRVVGMDLTGGDQRLLIVIHHLVVDGVSWRVLLEDLAAAYEQFVRGGEAAHLPPKTHAYEQWGAALHAHAGSDALATELAYWTAIRQAGDLPCDHEPAGRDTIADADEVSLEIKAELTARSLGTSHAAYRTQVNDLLLSALARALWQWSERETVVVELEGHGREDIGAGLDLSRTIGWFTTAFPVQLAGGGQDPASLIKATKEMLRAVPHRGLGYGILRYLGSDAQRNALAGCGQPRIGFNYLGQMDDGAGEAALFALAPESAGPSRAASSPLRHQLAINARVQGGRLQLSFSFSRKRFRKATVVRLADCYERALAELVEHCAGDAHGLTPSDVPLSKLTQAELDALALDWREVEDIYPLSPMQQGMLFHALHDDGTGVYVNQLTAEIRGLDPDKLRAAWQAVTDRHAVLRTGFLWQDLSGSPQQVVYRRAEMRFSEEDWRGRAAGLAPPALNDALNAAARHERAEGFDLSRPPLQRLSLIRLDDDLHWLIWTHHHILMDGWSSARFMAEVMLLLEHGSLPAQKLRYRDYIAWLQARDHDAASAFWRAALAELDEPSLLASGRADGIVGHGSLTVAVDPNLSESLQRFATRERVTLNTVVQAAWAQLLRRYTGQDTVCFGVTVSDRPAGLAGAEEMIGLFINTLPVVDREHPEQRVGAWLRELQDRNLALREHGWMPLADIQRLAGRAGRPLFDSILVFENYPVDQALKTKRGHLSASRTQILETSNYPLFVSVGLDGELRLVFNFQRQHFDEIQIRRLQTAFVQLLAEITSSAEQAVGRVTADDADNLAMLARVNDTVSATAFTGLVAQFETQAARAPEAIALVHGDETISYGELNARANRLASRLRAHGVGADVVVGLALERSVTMMVALLAVLKAGGAYLPLDPDYPAERLAHMLSDSGAKLLLTQAALQERFAAVLERSDGEAWLLDAMTDESDASNPDIASDPENLAYVIYTSGSTGLPKGVMVRHGAVTNFLATMAEQPGIMVEDRVLGLTSLSFDIAVLELWLPLTHGARVVLADRSAALDPAVLKAMVAKHGVTMIQATPSSWRMLLDHDEGTAWLPRGCRLLSGGEALAPDLARRLTALSGEVWNLYGPTETTVWSARHRLDAGDPSPMIGGPIGNTTLHVLDADLNLAPVGVAGELFIGGEGLARGYWNRAALSAERFIPDPFGAAGARLYRTGDLARWRADGVLDHVGRADHQVKIRGHRIELGEIEARLRECPGVRDSVVVAQDLGGSRHLVGYVSGDDALDSAALRASLASVLPATMVPSRVMVLPKLPLTPNGKIDRKALPLPDARPAEAQRVAPRNPTEAALAAVWAELLRQQDVGVTDNFFELGGDSIISLQVVSRARRAGLVLEPRDVFRHQTIEQLAPFCRAAQSDQRSAVLTRGALAGLADAELARLGLDWDCIEDIYPLSPMQQGMLFHSLRDAGSGVYVNQISVEIRGLDVERLRAAWHDVSARHPMLRTGFLWRELSGSPLQAVYHQAIVPFETDDWCGQAIDENRLSAALAGERDAEFDLTRPPLQRVRLLRVADDCHRLIWTHHHILMDGWSSARFIGEILQTYAGRMPAPNPSHYRDYIAWLVAQDAKAAERFWRGHLAAFDQPTQLADAFGARRHDAHGHRRCYTRLDQDATTAVKAFARRERITLNTLIQGIWTLLLQRYTGQQTVSFGVTVAGRPAGLDGAEQMIGLFINTLPMIETPSPASTVGDWLRAMQSRNAAIRNYEQTPLYDIQSWAGRPGETMFDSIIVFENYPIDRGLLQADESLQFGGMRNVDVTNYPMDLSVMVEDTLQVEFTYMPSHFTPEQAERIRAQFEHLFAALTRDSAALVGAVAAATVEDTARALACNAHAVPAASRPLVHQAISGHALADPERIALTIGGNSLSYGALEQRANRLAHHLIARGLAPDQRVAVVVERTEATMLALLAVLKAGGAYVPVDPELPPERIAYVLRDSGAAFLLAGAGDVAAPDGVVRIDLAGFDFDEGPDHPPQPRLHPENLAYVIYTSGSTGRPKGVAVAHGPLAMHCRATAALYDIDAQSCELHFLSLAFDGAHERWLTVLSQGARLVMRDAELWTPEQTVETARAHGVTHLGLPPAYLQQVADWVEQTGNPPPVRLYSFGGEAMPKAGFDKVKRTLEPQILINGYGPTETVVTPLVWKVDGRAECDKPYAPIGVPVGNRTAYILDDHLNVVPAGAPGELYLGGFGLARGYHARPSLTAERFIPDPFASDPGARLYRTGDLARWDADGVIEYLGRGDDQVKVSGFRIELGEIQSALLSEQPVAQAAVLAVPGAGGNQLIAYVAPNNAADAAGRSAEQLSASLAASLRRSLPAYMVPARIIVLDHLPTLSSGKVDRKALPAPDTAARAFIAPESPAEIAMARLWSDVLGVAQVGVTDNFFELGGNSILSLKVIARLRREPVFGSEIKLRDLLQKPTIRALLGTPASQPTRPSALLPLNAPVPGMAPVFCVHGGFGTVFDYAPLARCMEGRRQLLGLQCRSLIAPSFADESLAAMAVDYADEIVKVQGSGPYHLIGWSLGGLIASLVAAELERRGKEVVCLGLIDSFVPHPQRRAARDSERHWTDDLLGLLSVAAPGVKLFTISSQVAALRDADTPDTDEAIRRLVASAIETASAQVRDRLLGIDDIVGAFRVGRHLARLASAADWPANLVAEPACWWTSGRLDQRDLLEARLTGAVDLGVVGDDHFSILGNETFLSAISSWLEPRGVAPTAHALQHEPAE